MTGKRHNICLLIAKITDYFSSELAKGAIEAAKQLDVNLTVMPGNYLAEQSISGYGFDKNYEYQYNVLFDYASMAHFDYVIAAVGTIAYSADSARIKEFLKKFRDTHVLCVASNIDNYNCLCFDNKSGICNAVKYLAEQGRRNIAIMAGVPDNYDCIDRVDAYRKALEECGLPYRQELVRYCDIAYESAEDIKRLMNDEPEIDAILCVNDIIASIAYKVIEEKGLEVGSDVAVVGFDDHPFSKDLVPPLATIRADARLMGTLAVKKAVSRLDNKRCDIDRVETEFVPRQSCYMGMRSLIAPAEIFSGDMASMKKALLDYSETNLPDVPQKERVIESIDKFIDFVEESFIKNIATEETKQIVISTIYNLISNDWNMVTKMARMDVMHEVFYMWTLRTCRPENIRMIKEIYDILKNDHHRFKNKQMTDISERSHLENLFIRDSLSVSMNLHTSYAAVLKRLCNVGSRTSYLYILENPIIHNAGFEFPRDISWRFKAYSYGANTVTIRENEQKMYTAEIFKNSFLVSDRPRILIAAPLFSAATQYGLALFEPEDHDFFDELELVTYQLSSVVRTLEVLKELNENLSDIYDRNTALENESRTDELTRVFNRRGFYSAADEMIAANKQKDDEFVVCYTDTDKLREINDSYGHFQGDYTIKLASDCLRHAFGKSALIGRMGGGEFAVLVGKSQIISVEDIVRRKERFISDFNSSKLKPYHFNITIGLVESKLLSRADLEDSIENACELILTKKNSV